MGKVGTAVLALVIGLIAGGIGGTTLAGGAMAGAGAATGLTTGICATVQAAQEIGALTPEQVDQVLNRAAQNLAAKAGAGQSGKVVSSAAACREFMANFAK
jgi:hypothetical protein